MIKDEYSTSVPIEIHSDDDDVELTLTDGEVMFLVAFLMIIPDTYELAVSIRQKLKDAGVVVNNYSIRGSLT